MVAIAELAFLVLMAVVGVVWLTHSKVYRAHRRSPATPGQISALSSLRWAPFKSIERDEPHSHRDS